MQSLSSARVIQLEGCVDWPQEEAERYRRLGYWTGEPLDQMLRRAREQFPERGALFCGARRLSYAELDQEVDRLAAGLLRLGIAPGDRVVVQLPNRAEFVEACFALFRLGAIPVMALPGHRSAEIRHLCESTEAVAYLCADQQGGFDFRSIARTLTEHAGRALRWVIVVGDAAEFIAYEQLKETPRELPVIQASQIALLQLSGGSTGVSKLIPRTHDDYLYSVRESARICQLTPETRFLVVLPAGHNYTLSSPGILGCLWAGSQIVFCPSPDPDTAFPLLLEHKINWVALVPSLAQVWRLALSSRQLSFPDLRVIQVGGARLPDHRAEELLVDFQCQLQQVFGMAEGLVNYTRLDDSLERITQTQGRPISPDDEIRVVDDSDQEVPSGEVGHLLTRGPYTIRGYYRSPEQNKKSFTSDGFYRTGDLVRRTSDGYLIVEGRAKELINRGGEKVAPDDVEQHLMTHPAISEAAIVGQEDALVGERIVAFLVLRPGMTLKRPGVVAHLRQRGLAQFKWPDVIHWVESLPKTKVGKIDKKQLRSWLEHPEKRKETAP